MMKMSLFVVLLGFGSISVNAQTLLHHYTFDSDVSDSAGSANGTLSGGANVSSGVLNLSGSGQFVDFAEHLVPTSGSYSVTLFAQEGHAVGNYAEMISQGSSGAGFYIGHSPEYAIRAGDAWISTGVLFPSDGAQHHYGLVVDSNVGQSKLYLDGLLAATLGAALTSNAGADNTRLGTQFSGFGEFFNGNLDDVRVYSGALTAPEVANIAAGVPEPSAISLGLVAALGFAGWRWKRRGWSPASGRNYAVRSKQGD